MLDVPAYIADARIASADARYVWDEWNVRSYFMIADEAELARFDALTGKAKLISSTNSVSGLGPGLVMTTFMP